MTGIEQQALTIEQPRGVRRTDEQLAVDRELVFNLVIENPGMSMTAITDLFNEIRGTSLVRQTIEYDYRKAIEAVMEKLSVDGKSRAAVELRRLDIIEQRLWVAYDRSSEPLTQRVIEKRIDKHGDEYVVGIKETHEYRDGDARILDKIMAVQKERRKLLGLYMPQRVEIDKRVVNVKGYVGVSPDDWDVDPQLIEGEIE